MSTHTEELDRWLVRPRRNPGAGILLLCFPFAGGGIAGYRGWAERMPSWIELGLVRLPGRESRLRESALTSMDEVVTALCRVLGPVLDMPLAFFGHSLGALIAFELAHRLGREHGLEPIELLVSGRAAPHVQPPEPKVHALPDRELIDVLVQRYNGIPQAILDEPDMLNLYLPILRADFAVLESFVYAPGALLSCPVTALGGETDPRVERQQLAAWGELTRGDCRLHTFPGGHFYLHQERERVLDLVVETLTYHQIPV